MLFKLFFKCLKVLTKKKFYHERTQANIPKNRFETQTKFYDKFKKKQNLLNPSDEQRFKMNITIFQEPPNIF
jgi:hypothetical protein